MHYAYPAMPVGTAYLLMNIPVFCLGWRFVGKRFALYSLWGMVIYSGMLYAMTFRIEIADKMPVPPSSRVALSGAGVAIVLRSYGSTGAPRFSP